MGLSTSLIRRCIDQCFRGDFRAGLERIRELGDIDFLILDAEKVGEPALERQTPHQRKLTAFKVGRFGPAGTCILALRTAPCRFTLPGGNTPPYAALRFLCAPGSG